MHVLIEYPPVLSISEMVNALKGVSSRMVRRDCMPLIREHLWGDHFWSPSYFAASCGGAPLDVIAAYVATKGNTRLFSDQSKAGLKAGAHTPKGRGLNAVA